MNRASTHRALDQGPLRNPEPNPQRDRQLAADRPILLWRDRPGGGREALMIVAWACPFPECDDPHLDLTVFRLDGELQNIELDEFGVWTAERGGQLVDLEPAFCGAFDLASARLEVGPHTAPELVAWLRRELDAEVLAALGERYRAARDAGERIVGLFGLHLERPPEPDGPCPCGSGESYDRCCLSP